MSSSKLLAALLFLTVASACAKSSAGNTAVVAPTNQTVIIERQSALGLSKAQLYFVRNGSTVPVIVYQVSILDCLNLKQYCGINATNVRIEPGQRQEVIRLEPQDDTKAFNYRLQWRWRGAPRTGPIAVRPAAPGDTIAVRRAAALELVQLMRSEDAKYGDKILNPNTLSAIGDNFASMRADPDTVEIAVGSRLFIFEQLRILALDKNGTVLGRIRAPLQWSVVRSQQIRFLTPDTLQADAAGSTTVTMRLVPSALIDTMRAKAMAPVVFLSLIHI